MPTIFISCRIAITIAEATLNAVEPSFVIGLTQQNSYNQEPITVQSLLAYVCISIANVRVIIRFKELTQHKLDYHWTGYYNRQTST